MMLWSELRGFGAIAYSQWRYGEFTVWTSSVDLQF